MPAIWLTLVRLAFSSVPNLFFGYMYIFSSCLHSLQLSTDVNILLSLFTYNTEDN